MVGNPAFDDGDSIFLAKTLRLCGDAVRAPQLHVGLRGLPFAQTFTMLSIYHSLPYHKTRNHQKMLKVCT